MILLDTQLNIFFQNLGAWLLPVMQFISVLGTTEFLILLTAAIYWCFDPGLGLRIGLVLLSSSCLNSILKLGFHLPRPYWVDAHVQALSAESSFGFPSSHSQMSATAWGMLGFSRKSRLTRFAALFIILLVGISRMYLGMHFSADVAAGWLLGFLVLAAFYLVDRPLRQWAARTNPPVVALCAIVCAILILGCGIVVYAGLLTWQIPVNWQQLASRGGRPINPVSLANLFSGVGTLIGFALGACWLRSQESTWGAFNAAGTIVQKIWRYLIGLAGVLFITSGFGWALAGNETFTGLAMRLLCFGLVGGWISGLAPYIFFRTRLVNPQSTFDVESTKSAD